MTDMNEAHLVRLDQVQQFLDGTEAVSFTMASKAECYRLDSTHTGTLSLS